MSHSKDDFLRQVRQAVRAAPNRPVSLPAPVPVTPVADLHTQFAAALQSLQAELICAESFAQAAAALPQTVPPDDRPWFVADRELARKLASHLSLTEAPASDMAACQASITEAQCLIADTGTVGLHLDARQPRGCYLLPEVHVVVATSDRLLPTLADALKRLEQLPQLPTACVFVTGPSRTADIEKTIVIPAHGPKRLIVVCLPPA